MATHMFFCCVVRVHVAPGVIVVLASRVSLHLLLLLLLLLILILILILRLSNCI